MKGEKDDSRNIERFLRDESVGKKGIEYGAFERGDKDQIRNGERLRKEEGNGKKQ